MLPTRTTIGLCLSVVAALSMSALILAAPADTPVADAAMRGDLEGLRALLKQGADVNAAQGDGMTALHWAAFKDDVEMAEILTYAGANLAAVTRVNAISPLFLAAQNGSATMVETLLEAGADANAAMGTGTTPLMLTAASGSAAAVAALIDSGADPNATETRYGQTPLMFAAALNRVDAMTALLEGGADATVTTNVVDVVARNRRNGRGRFGRRQIPQGRGGPQARRGGRGGGGAGDPLLSASGIPISSGNAGSVNRQELAAAAETAAQRRRRGGGMGERVPRVATMGGLSALLYAARQGHFEATDLLLEAGMEIDEQSPGDKTTPLFMAVINGHFDLAKHLLDKGADPTIPNVMGGTPVYAAANVKWAPDAGYPQPDTTQQKTTYLELMQAFIDKGADVNARLERELWFTSYNFDLSRVTSAGATAFWRVAQVSDVAAMKLLIAAGADPTIANNNDVTPLHVATGGGVHGNDEVTAPGGWMPAVRYLVDELDADVNAVDSRGYRPLHNAAAIGHHEMVQFLFANGGDVTVVSEAGQTVADMANGPRQRIQPFPETIALLLKLGSPYNDNCVSC